MNRRDLTDADLSGNAPLLGGPLTAEAGAEESDEPAPSYDARADAYVEPADQAPALPEPAEVQMISERIRARIGAALDEMLAERDSVWLG